MSQVTTDQAPLITLDPTSVKQELIRADGSLDGDPELLHQADSTVDMLLAIDPSDRDRKQQGIGAVENMGIELQKMAARRSDMLKQSISSLAKSGEDGGPVAQSLVDLQIKVEELDPNKFDFSMNFFRRLIGALPFIGSPLNQYFSRYQSADTVISNIVTSLEKGRDQLKRDNITLEDDQKHMYDLAHNLERAISFGQIVDKKLTHKVEQELVSDDPKTAFIKEEIIFPLRQRIIDLQQQQAVAQQAVLTIEVIKRNNKELIRGVTRALGVTVNALQVAVTLALALANQKIVLEKIEAINKTTDNLIAQTAANLKQQGAAIHKQAASAAINMDTLKQAFADINAAINDISRYRHDALPKMASTIVEMDQLSAEANKAIQKFDQAKEIDDSFGFDIIDVNDKPA